MKNTYTFLETSGHKLPDSFSLEDKTKIELAISLIEEELNELKKAYQENNLIEYLDACVDLSVVLGNATFFAGITLQQFNLAEREVFRSNMSKFDIVEDDARISVQMYKDKGIDAYYKKVNNHYVIFRSSDNKILKSHNFKPPVHNV